MLRLASSGVVVIVTAPVVVVPVVAPVAPSDSQAAGLAN